MVALVVMISQMKMMNNQNCCYLNQNNLNLSLNKKTRKKNLNFRYRSMNRRNHFHQIRHHQNLKSVILNQPDLLLQYNPYSEYQHIEVQLALKDLDTLCFSFFFALRHHHLFLPELKSSPPFLF